MGKVDVQGMVFVYVHGGKRSLFDTVCCGMLKINQAVLAEFFKKVYRGNKSYAVIEQSTQSQ